MKKNYDDYVLQQLIDDMLVSAAEVSALRYEKGKSHAWLKRNNIPPVDKGPRGTLLYYRDDVCAVIARERGYSDD